MVGETAASDEKLIPASKPIIEVAAAERCRYGPKLVKEVEELQKPLMNTIPKRRQKDLRIKGDRSPLKE